MNDPASLQNLQNIFEPAAISFWPPAPGVWMCAALALLWSGVGLALFLIRRKRNGYRRVAKSALVKIRQNLNHEGKSQAIMSVATLLKRAALTAFPRNRVASLSGRQWLDFLDEAGGDSIFSASSRDLLLKSVYQPREGIQALSLTQIAELCHQAEVWISSHKADIPPGKKGRHPKQMEGQKEQK
jgi:hypothetical protein